MAKALDPQAIAAYLQQQSTEPVELVSINSLGNGTSPAAALKAFGYGRPVLLTYRVGGTLRRAVLRRVNRNGYGRERSDDRVAEVWLDYETFGLLPRHVAARDMVGLQADGRLETLGHYADVLLLTDYAPGFPYADDLAALRDGSPPLPLDMGRARALATYLAEIHAVKLDDPLLWRRRLRDLIGHGEGIMGLTDSYNLAVGGGQGTNGAPLMTAEYLREIERLANDWRWRLKPMAHRLSQVHGDFHPFNILFPEGSRDPDGPDPGAEGLTFMTIDRSRGAWGEPADDVTCLAINYLFFSLQRSGRFEGVFADLYDVFWQTYVSHSGDTELTAVAGPWFAWRALVLASPQWYPTLSDDVRNSLLTFARNVLLAPRYEWAAANAYLGVA